MRIRMESAFVFLSFKLYLQGVSVAVLVMNVLLVQVLVDVLHLTHAAQVAQVSVQGRRVSAIDLDLIPHLQQRLLAVKTPSFRVQS